MITAQNILTLLGRRAWSGFNIDDMVFESEDSEQAKAELNAALRYLINLEDFPFKTATKNFMAIAGIEKYSMPNGQISEIYNSDTLDKLEFITNYTDISKTEKGTPIKFWVTPKNPKEYIRLYPIPDKMYNYTIVYNQFMPVKKKDGTLSFEFTSADDYINLPARLEYLFVDCLVLRTMAQNNKDEQDENYRPTLNELEEYWKLFKKTCQTVKTQTRIVW